MPPAIAAATTPAAPTAPTAATAPTASTASTACSTGRDGAATMRRTRHCVSSKSNSTVETRTKLVIKRAKVQLLLGQKLRRKNSFCWFCPPFVYHRTLRPTNAPPTPHPSGNKP